MQNGSKKDVKNKKKNATENKPKKVSFFFPKRTPIPCLNQTNWCFAPCIFQFSKKVLFSFESDAPTCRLVETRSSLFLRIDTPIKPFAGFSVSASAADPAAT